MMIQQFLNRLSKRHIYLASSSPRRQKILSDIGLSLKVVPSTFDENLELSDFSSVNEFVTETARCKALEVWNRVKMTKVLPDLIIGADTVVYLDGKVYGKPKTKEKAITMLQQLGGRTHKVITGVALLLADYTKEDVQFEVSTFYEETYVDICSLTSDVIKSYVDTGEPLDKAGGYAIQGSGGTLIRRIDGDYFNVVGFPLHRFCKEVYRLCSENLL